jgi:hypothetical protein
MNMKNVFFLMVILIFSVSAMAQVPPPQAFNYQGIARDGSGAPLTNRAISLRLSILQSALGSIVYQETHNITTSKLGVFNVEVGNGTSQLGQLQDIDWGLDEYYIQTEMDPDGGTNYTLLGQAQLLSVPYALYAGEAASANNLWQSNGAGINYNDGNVGIGTSSPDSKLVIEGDDPIGDNRIYADLYNQSTSNRSLVILNLRAGSANTSTSLQHFSDTYDFDGDNYTDFGVLSSTGRGMILRADDPDGVLKFMTRGNGTIPAERMRMTALGNLGIGTADPASRLQVTDGDVFIEDVSKGVIMKSPNGNCWRMTINNDGSVNTASIPCPN